MPGDLRKQFGDKPNPPDPQLVKSWQLAAGLSVVSASWSICALGYVDPFVSGQRLFSSALNPAVTDFSKRRLVMEIPVPPGYFKSGENWLGLWLGRGWYARGLPGVEWTGPLIKAHLRVQLSDGSHREVVTDPSWRARRGPYRPLGTYDWGHFGGEEYDERADSPDWWCPAPLAAGWIPAPCQEVTVIPEILQECALTALTATDPILDWSPAGDGSLWGDLKRCVTGQLELTVEFPADHVPGEITLEYADKLLPDGSGQTYDQLDRWLPGGTGRRTFRNRFEYHAFRYVQLRGLPPGARVVASAVRIIRNDYPTAGTFNCSDASLNLLFQTIRHTAACLLQGGVLQDCPHRERLGYGDGQAPLEAAIHCFDLSGLLKKWFRDWQDVQDPRTGDLKHTAPSPYAAGGGPAWSAGGLHLAHQLERYYGDDTLRPEAYRMAKGLIQFLKSKMSGGILRHYGSESWGFLGDWVAPGKGMMPPDRVDADSTLFFNNCYLIALLDHGVELAKREGAQGQAAEWARDRDALRQECHRRWFNPEQVTYANGEPTYLVMPLWAGVVPKEWEARVCGTLRRRIEVIDGGHVNTGVLGTWFWVQLCIERGWNDLLFTQATRRTFPGWGHMLANGATTIWEEWNGDNSQIHSCHLSIGQWFFQGIGGIRATSPGFATAMISPAVNLPLDAFECSYPCPHGRLATVWQRTGQGGFLMVEIPRGVSAELRLPEGVGWGDGETELPPGSVPLTPGRHDFFLRFHSIERAEAKRFSSKA